MLEFTKMELRHIPIIRPYFWRQKRRVCDCTIGGAFMWREYFNDHFAIVNDTLVIKVDYPGGETMFAVPIGADVEGALELVKEYAHAKGIKVAFCSVVPGEVELLRKVFGAVTVEENRDWYDYLYESRDLVEFSGRKYATQRNHIHRFERECPDHSFLPLGSEDMEQVKQFYRSFTQGRGKDTETAREEEEKTFEVLDNFETYGLVGGVLRVGEQIAGISVGEVVRDTLFIHIEKADLAYPGVYQKLVNSFARMYVSEDVAYINREEDVGDPGLRKSKMSYRPLTLLEKVIVRVEHEC